MCSTLAPNFSIIIGQVVEGKKVGIAIHNTKVHSLGGASGTLDSKMEGYIVVRAGLLVSQILRDSNSEENS